MRDFCVSCRRNFYPVDGNIYCPVCFSAITMYINSTPVKKAKDLDDFVRWLDTNADKCGYFVQMHCVNALVEKFRKEVSDAG